MNIPRFIAGPLALALTLAYGAGSLAADQTLDGTFALASGVVKTRGHLRATPIGGDPLREHLDFWMTPASSDAAILHYTVDMTKLLHVIIVSDDFTQFLHVHPVLGADGHFALDQTFPKKAHYDVYADGEPQHVGQQVFRFALDLGGKRTDPIIASTGDRVAAGPYSVELNSVSVKAGTDARLIVHVRRNGKPASDLHPYLGALAHCVFLNARDLAYTHVHPAPLGSGAMSGMSGMSSMGAMDDMAGMEMKPLPDSAKSSPDMELYLHLREPGTYKLWLQFRGGSSLEVAPFTITAT